MKDVADLVKVHYPVEVGGEPFLHQLGGHVILKGGYNCEVGGSGQGS